MQVSLRVGVTDVGCRAGGSLVCVCAVKFHSTLKSTVRGTAHSENPAQRPDNGIRPDVREHTLREHNVRARRLYEKMGFVVEGVKRRGVRLDGSYEDLICMAYLIE